MTLIGLAARNITRNKFRSVLTILAVAVATITFVFLRTVLGSWGSSGFGSSEGAAQDRVVTRNKSTINMPIPIRYADEIRAMPHVKAATHQTWFDGHDPNHEKEFFGVFAVETSTFLNTVGGDYDIPADQQKAWLDDRQAILVGDLIAKKLGWKVGDKVNLRSGLYPPPPGEQWTFNVAAIYHTKSKAVSRNSMYTHWAYLNDRLVPRRQNQCNFVLALADSAGAAADLSRSIDKNFQDKELATLTQDERSFRTSFLANTSAILGALNIITIAIMLIMMLILGNTIAMGVRERTNEYGVLRALGFMPRHVAIFILGEAMLTGLLGGLLGLAIAYPLIQFGMGPQIEANMTELFPSFKVSPLAIALAISSALGLGAFAALVPAIRASQLKIVDALRRVA